MTRDVSYTLYLGYADSTVEMFSSLCMLEATDAFQEKQHNLRLLQDSIPEVELQRVSPDIKMLTSGASTNVTIRGNDALRGVKFGVVLAHIFR